VYVSRHPSLGHCRWPFFFFFLSQDDECGGVGVSFVRRRALSSSPAVRNRFSRTSRDAFHVFNTCRSSRISSRRGHRYLDIYRSPVVRVSRRAFSRTSSSALRVSSFVVRAARTYSTLPSVRASTPLAFSFASSPAAAVDVYPAVVRGWEGGRGGGVYRRRHPSASERARIRGRTRRRPGRSARRP